MGPAPIAVHVSRRGLRPLLGMRSCWRQIMPRALRCFVGALVALPCLVTPALAASYPTRTVEIIVSYGAGGSTDIVARAVAQKLTERLGQPFVVLNRPGASGTIGIKTAMRRQARRLHALCRLHLRDRGGAADFQDRDLFGGRRFRADRDHRPRPGGADGLEERPGQQPQGLHRRDPRQPGQIHLRRRRRQPAARDGRLDEQGPRISTSRTFPTAAARRA